MCRSSLTKKIWKNKIINIIFISRTKQIILNCDPLVILFFYAFFVFIFFLFLFFPLSQFLSISLMYLHAPYNCYNHKQLIYFLTSFTNDSFVANIKKKKNDTLSFIFFLPHFTLCSATRLHIFIFISFILLLF